MCDHEWNADVDAQNGTHILLDVYCTFCDEEFQTSALINL